MGYGYCKDICRYIYMYFVTGGLLLFWLAHTYSNILRVNDVESTNLFVFRMYFRVRRQRLSPGLTRMQSLARVT